MTLLPSARIVRRMLCLATLPLMLTACGPTTQQRVDYDAVQKSGVSPAIYDKMLHDDPLSISDIADLGHARVNDGVIIRYVRDHGTIYYLGPADTDYLAKAGVSQS